MIPLMICTAAPAEKAVDRTVVWSYLALNLVDGAPDNADFVDELIDAAIDRLDGPTGLLNRALISQSWTAYYGSFAREMKIPLARCQSVDSVKYLATDGTLTTLDPPLYRVTGLLTDDCRIRPAVGTSWPATLWDREAVQIAFTSGFGDDTEDVPASIRHALMEMVATAYDLREAVALGQAFSSLPGSASSAVTDWMVYPDVV